MTEDIQPPTLKSDLLTAEKAFADVFAMVTESGMPMEEYVPQDYPRSSVVYAHKSFAEALTARDIDYLPVKALPSVEGAFIAGGYAADLFLESGRGESKDVDIFFASEAAFTEMAEKLHAAGYNSDIADKAVFDIQTGKLIPGEALEKRPYIQFYAPADANPEVRKRTVQLVKIRWYKDVEHVIDAFDFTCVQFALDLAKQEVVYNPAGVWDWNDCRIVQHRVESRARVSMRLAKYRDKGFRPTDAFVLPPDTTVNQHPVVDTQKVEF